jgi:hypothetical protein
LRAVARVLVLRKNKRMRTDTARVIFDWSVFAVVLAWMVVVCVVV